MSIDMSGTVPDKSRTCKTIPPCSAAASQGNNGSISASERISLEREGKEIKAWLKANRQETYTDVEAEMRRKKKERLTKIEKATHIPL